MTAWNYCFIQDIIFFLDQAAPPRFICLPGFEAKVDGAIGGGRRPRAATAAADGRDRQQPAFGGRDRRRPKAAIETAAAIDGSRRPWSMRPRAAIDGGRRPRWRSVVKIGGGAPHRKRRGGDHRPRSMAAVKAATDRGRRPRIGGGGMTAAEDRDRRRRPKIRSGRQAATAEEDAEWPARCFLALRIFGSSWSSTRPDAVISGGGGRRPNAAFDGGRRPERLRSSRREGKVVGWCFSAPRVCEQGDTLPPVSNVRFANSLLGFLIESARVGPRSRRGMLSTIMEPLKNNPVPLGASQIQTHKPPRRCVAVV